jgi:hypothetical protein
VEGKVPMDRWRYFDVRAGQPFIEKIELVICMCQEPRITGLWVYVRSTSWHHLNCERRERPARDHSLDCLFRSLMYTIHQFLEEEANDVTVEDEHLTILASLLQLQAGELKNKESCQGKSWKVMPCHTPVLFRRTNLYPKRFLPPI